MKEVVGLAKLTLDVNALGEVAEIDMGENALADAGHGHAGLKGALVLGGSIDRLDGAAKTQVLLLFLINVSQQVRHHLLMLG